MTERIKKTLVGVDGNKDFTHKDGALCVPNKNRLPGEPTHNQIIRRGIAMFDSGLFDLRFMTTENHPPNHIEFVRHGVHGLFNTPGQKYHPALIDLLTKANMVLEKGQHPDIISYSAVYSPLWIPHISMMRVHNIEEVYLWGWYWTHCLGRTAVEYSEQGFRTFVVKDATMGIPDVRSINYMREMLKLAEVEYVTTRDLGINA
jgi:nicotinamidase-related amidase